MTEWLNNLGIESFATPERLLAVTRAIVILGVDQTEEAQKVLAANWVKTLGREAYNV